MLVFVIKPGHRAKKSSTTPLWGHRLPITALELSARGLDNLHNRLNEIGSKIILSILRLLTKLDLQPKRFCALIKNSLHQIGPFSFRSCTAKIARSLKCVYNVQGKQCISLSSAAAERWWRFVEKGKVCETLPLCFSTSQTVPQLNRESEKKRESCL